MAQRKNSPLRRRVASSQENPEPDVANRLVGLRRRGDSAPTRVSSRERSNDIFIAGGGYVGLSLGVAIRDAAPGLNVLVADAAPSEALERDARASALAAAAVRMLERLQVWKGIEDEAQPIREMIVTDSRLSDPVRPTFLSFAQRDGTSDQPFAHMIPNRVLIRALRERAEEIGVELAHERKVTGFALEESSIRVETQGEADCRARLLVAADGVRSALREMAGIQTVSLSYDQCGIVATVAHERPHQGRAEEHFLPAGPFAILPLKGNRSSLVWTERVSQAESLMRADRLVFEAELQRRFGRKLGKVSLEGEPRSFPLGLTLAREYVQERFALAGDAAHGIHPIAGQGLNLGFRDAAALSETITDAYRLGLDFGSLAVLERYRKWRRFDTVRMGMLTDALNRLFSNDNSFLRAIRGIGLGMVNKMPGLKRSFIEQAADADSNAPRLLR